MASKVAEDHCNTETDEGNQKKRSRRVSFAEITSVRFFDRDDEYETPPDPKPSSDDPESAQTNEGFGFHRDSTDGEDSKELSQNEEEEEEDDDHELDARTSFLRPMESPSPGSTFGSATSNDEDNFFGPVSASFIRPGRLSDSAASDENHDITMDSTAFSMHFRSLARSDSGGDLKTPTGVHLSFEEKTPTQDTVSSNLGSSMVLTVAKEPISVSSTVVDKLSGNSYSNDMSLVEENPRKYDYGRLSPGLNALLAEGNKDMHAVSVSDKITISKSPINMKSMFSLSKKHGGSMEPNDSRDKEMGPIGIQDMPAEAVSFARTMLDDANGGYNSSPICLITNGFLSDMHNAPASDASIDKKNWSPNQLTKGLLSGTSKESDAVEIRRPNLDFNAFNCGTPSNLDNKVHQLNVSAPHECESPLAGPMSSLSAKQRRIVLDSASPSKNLQITTPSPKQPGSFVRDEIRKLGESVSSIQKSISKLEMLEASPFSSTLIDSTLLSSEYLSKTPRYNTILDRNREDAQTKCVDASVACCKDQLFIIDQENGEHKYSTNIDGNDFETSENIMDLSHAKGSTGLTNVGISPSLMSPGILCREQPIKLMEAGGLLSQFTWSGKKTQMNLSTCGDPTEGMVVNSGSDAVLARIMLDHAKDEKPIGTSHKTVPSPQKNIKKTSLTSTEYRGSLSTNLRLYDQDNKIISIEPGHDADSRENIRSASLLTTVANKLDTLFMEKAQSSSPIIEIKHSKEITGIETTDGREINFHALQDESGTIGNLQTRLTDQNTKKIQSIILDEKLQIGTDLVRFKEDLTRGEIKVSSRGSASPFVHRGHNEPPNHKKMVELFTQSPSRKELCNATHNDKLHSFVVENVSSPNTSQLRNGFENFSAPKRKREDVTPRGSHFLDEIARSQRSPKLHKSACCDSEFLSEHHKECTTETSSLGREARLEHWADVFSNFSADTKQLISPSIDKLNLKAIGVLEDVLVNLRRLQIYEMLSTEIRSQKSFENLSNFQQKRVAEMRLLLHRVVHEQAKLQLMLVKRERLLKKVQLLSSGIQESQMLKLNSLPRLSIPCARDAFVDHSHCQSVNFDGIQEEEVASDKVTALKQVLDASERKVLSLTKSFHTSCKMTGEPSCGDTILLVNDHLKKKARCRFIRLDLQLWEVANLENTNGQHNLVLNYLGFIIQCFTINVGPVSSIVISNKLNDVNILKNFPNMDVCTAFAFVFDANTSRNYVGSRSLTQETQIASSVLGNLVDVVEEVQVARLELQNLTDASFHSPSVKQLELHLHFIDSSSGRKVALILDMSCLKWGIYPSEIIPSQLESPSDVSRKSLPEPLSAEIIAAVQSVSVGYLRITNLCRCVSQVVQSWSG